MHCITKHLLNKRSLGRGILHFSTLLFVTMVAPCSSRSQHGGAVLFSANAPAVSACKSPPIRPSASTGRVQTVGICPAKRTVLCTVIKPSHYVCPAGQNCTLPLCAAVYGGKNQKPESDSLHPYSIDHTLHLPEKDSQKQAVHFVAQQWSSQPKGQHYHSVPSDELLFLEQAYTNQFFTPCGDDGRLTNTAPFTLTQVYVAYYMALAAIESLADLKQYEQTEVNEKTEKRQEQEMQAAMKDIAKPAGVPAVSQ